MSSKKKTSRPKEQTGHESLYVKGFGLEWSELDMFNVFRQFGEIENIKVSKSGLYLFKVLNY